MEKSVFCNTNNVIYSTFSILHKDCAKTPKSFVFKRFTPAMKTIARNNLALICLFLLFTNAACLKRQKQIYSTEILPNPNAVNLNTASVAQLEKLPGVGNDLAQRIIERRKNNGNFRKPEELLLLRGISEEKFREMRAFIKTD